MEKLPNSAGQLPSGVGGRYSEGAKPSARPFGDSPEDSAFGGAPGAGRPLQTRKGRWPLQALRDRPVLYVMAIFSVLVATALYSLRRDGIFACPASAYDGNHYLAYCNVGGYGDYDHGAFWFGLEPAARDFAVSADVLFVGNSATEFGFSTPASERWFAANGSRFYLLGFSHFENSTFIEPLLSRLHPRARAYVVNVDRFFSDQETVIGHDVMRGSDMRRWYIVKQGWQPPHRMLCTWQARLCGHALSFYRQRETGEWRLTGSEIGLTPSEIGRELPADAALVAQEKARAESFIAKLGVAPQCVFLTYVPSKANERATAADLASALGFELISPRISDLHTFDGIHLDPPSAERFASAFFDIGGARLRQCLNSNGTRSGADTSEETRGRR